MSLGLEALGLLAQGLPDSTSSSGPTTVDCAIGTTSSSGLSATVVIGAANSATNIDCGVGNSSVVGLSANVVLVSTATISITSPVSFQTHQRDSSDQANILVTGTYTGSPTTIQASFNGSSWITVAATPTGGSFSGVLPAQAMGQGTLSVRFGNDVSVTASVAKVKIGDIYIVFGQSNHVGQAPNYVAPSTINGNASEWAVDGTWRELTETPTNKFSTRSNGIQCSAMNQLVVDGQGSYFGALATKIMAAGVPVAFVPCAIGSSSIASWQPGANHSNPATIYGSALTRSQSVGGFKAALWWQGEADSLAATTYDTYVSFLNSLINAWYADTGKPVVVTVINQTGSGTLANVQTIQNAQLYVGRSNPHAIPGPNMDLVWTVGGVHYQTANDINAVAQKMFNVLSAQYYGGTVINCSVGTSAAAGLQADLNVTSIDCKLGQASSAGVKVDVSLVFAPTVISCAIGSAPVQGKQASITLKSNIIKYKNCHARLIVIPPEDRYLTVSL